MKGANSRWLKGRIRVSTERTLEDGRWVRHGSGWRFETEQVTERAWVDRRKESEGWRNGAKVWPYNVQEAIARWAARRKQEVGHALAS